MDSVVYHPSYKSWVLLLFVWLVGFYSKQITADLDAMIAMAVGSTLCLQGYIRDEAGWDTPCMTWMPIEPLTLLWTIVGAGASRAQHSTTGPVLPNGRQKTTDRFRQANNKTI